MSELRVLTGITTSGTPHLGNYVGAVRPAVRASLAPGVQSFYFLADYHALIKVGEPERIQQSTLEIAATWLAAGLDPQRVTFYRQSDIPEIPELTWFLTCVCGKGLLNRAHAYKAAVQANEDAGEDADFAITMGLFSYPVLMAADILMFNAHQIPVGRDQIQHVEMARDVAQRFNHHFGEHFVLPKALVDDKVAVLQGLDGRKMSKSYGNTIPLSATDEEITKAVMSIATDSRGKDEEKNPDDMVLYQIHKLFNNSIELKNSYTKGLGYGEAKKMLIADIISFVTPMRERRKKYEDDPKLVEEILLQGAIKANEVAMKKLQAVYEAVGLTS